MEERVNTAADNTVRLYAYGSDLIFRSMSVNAQPSTPSYYSHDGLGSVRELTDAGGNVTDAYDFDAFGILVHRTGATENAYLYRGERFDDDTGQYYLRARFYNQNSGRFWNQDSYEGSAGDPASLHKYLYAQGDTVGHRDPSGHVSLAEVQIGMVIVGTLNGMAIQSALNTLGQARDTFSATGDVADAIDSLEDAMFVVEVANLSVAAYGAVKLTGVLVSKLATKLPKIVSTLQNISPTNFFKLRLGSIARNGANNTSGLIQALEGNVPNPMKWIKKGGYVSYDTDGSITYALKDGTSVKYSQVGYPDFSPYSIREASITLTGSRYRDEQLANLAAGLDETPLAIRGIIMKMSASCSWLRKRSMLLFIIPVAFRIITEISRTMNIKQRLTKEVADEAALERFEKTNHFKLPKAYRDFLKVHNGGKPVESRFIFKTLDGKVQEDAVHYFYALHEERVGSLRIKLESMKDRIPATCLPIATDPFGNLILLELGEFDDGRIYFWDHELEDDDSNQNKNITLISPSFKQFVDKLE